MKSLENCRDIEAAGFAIRLIFHQAGLPGSIELPFPSAGRNRTPASVINIYSQQSAGRKKNAAAGKATISGEGEYEGAFNLHSRTGRINLDGPDNTAILINFLTQIFARLVVAGKGIMLHSACVIRQNKAYLFYGASGAGKSTVCRFSPGCPIASDDLTAVRKIRGHFQAWGIPQMDRFPAPAKYGPYPIGGLFKLVKDRKTALSRLDSATAVASAMALRKNESERGTIGKTLALLGELTDHVPAYELHFKKDISFWKCIVSELK